MKPRNCHRSNNRRRTKTGENYAVSNVQYEKLEPRKLLAIDFGPVANLVANGDFETAPSHSENRLSAANEVAGWQTLGSQNNQVLHVLPTKIEGSKYALHLDAKDDRHDIIYQNVNTEEGQSYLLTFDYVGQSGGQTRLSNDFSVFWNGEMVTRYQAGDIWQTGGVILEGGSYGTSRLEFRELAETSDVGGDGIGPILDNVFVQQWSQPSLVNEGFEQEGLKSWSRFRSGESVAEHQLNYKWAQEGAHVLELNANDDRVDRLVREFDLQPNQSYLISFDVKGTYGAESKANELRVRWNGEWVSTIRGADRWNRHFIEVTADSEGIGVLMMGEASSQAMGLGALVDSFELTAIPTSEILSRNSDAVVTEFSYLEYDGETNLTVAQKQTVQFRWRATNAVRYGLELLEEKRIGNTIIWESVDTSALMPGGSPHGNINANLPGQTENGLHNIRHRGSSATLQTYEWTIPRNLPADNYKIKIVAWDANDVGATLLEDGLPRFLDIEIESVPEFSVFVADTSIAPAQDRVIVSWRVSHELIQETIDEHYSGQTSNNPGDYWDDITNHWRIVTVDRHNITDNRKLSFDFGYADIEEVPERSGAFFDDVSFRDGSTKTDIKAFSTVLMAESIASGLYELEFRLEFSKNGFYSDGFLGIAPLAQGNAETDIRVDATNLTYTASGSEFTTYYSSPSQSVSFNHSEATARRLFDAAGIAFNDQDFLSCQSASFVNTECRVIHSLIQRQLETNSSIGRLGNDPNSLPAILNDAFGGAATAHSWNPDLPTLIAVHGIRTDSASHIEFGESLSRENQGRFNVVTFWWDRVGLTAGNDRVVKDLLARSDFWFEKRVQIAGAADLHGLIELVDSVSAQSGMVSLAAHSQGTVVTSMALSMFAASDLNVRSTLFIGANIDQKETNSGRFISNLNERFGEDLRIENLYSAFDTTVRWGTFGLSSTSLAAALTGAGNMGFEGSDIDHVIFTDSVFSHDTLTTGIGEVFGRLPAIFHTRAIAAESGNSYAFGWWDWVVEKEKSDRFLSESVGAIGAGDFLDWADEYSIDRPVAESGQSSGSSSSSSSYNVSPTAGDLILSNDQAGRNNDNGIEVERGDSVVARAEGAIDPDGGELDRAEFYWDKNNDGLIQTSEKIGTDYSPNRGWQKSFGTSNFPLGEITILGVVVDDEGTYSLPIENRFFITDPNAPPEELPAVLPNHRQVDYQIATNRNGDIYYASDDYLLDNGRVDFWAIAPRTGASFNFETYGSTNTALGIYDFTTGELLDFDKDNGSGDNAELRYDLESEKTYVIAVVAEDGDSGEYDFEVRSVSQSYTGEFDVQAPLYTETIADSIATPFGVDYFRMDSPDSATRITVSLDSFGDLDGWVRLEDWDYNTIATAYLRPEGETDIIEARIEGGQRYRVTVSSTEETVGTYELNVDFNPDESGLPPEVDPWPNAIPLIPLHTGELELSGLSIDDPNEFDFYYLTTNSATATQNEPKTYTFETTGDLDTQIGVYSDYDEFGSDLIAGDDDSGAGKNGSITLDLESGQRYVILVRSDASETGEYSLRMQRPPEERITPIFINGLESKGFKSIKVSANTTRYHMFEVTAPDNATEMSLLADLTDAPTDISMRVHDAAGNILAFVDDNAVGGDEELLNFTVEGGETYYVTINNKNFEDDGLSPRLFVDFDPNFATDGGDEFVVNTTTFNRQWRPVVDSNSSGEVVAAWESWTDQSGNGGNFVFFQRLDIDGTPVGSETLVASDAFFSVMAVRESGDFIIGWREGTGDTKLQRYNSNGTTSGSIITSEIGGSSSIALKDNGEFLLVGYHDDRLTGRVYNANGTPKSASFVVDKTEDSTDEPVVAIDSLGNYVIVFESIEQDESLLLMVVDANGQFVELEDKYELGEVAGIWFDDANQNGGFDVGESPISGKQLFLDANFNGVQNSGELVATTDNFGRYLFVNANPGYYQVLAVDGSQGGGVELSDSFDRADSTDLGAEWIELRGDFRIEGNQLRPPVDSVYSLIEFVPFDATNTETQTMSLDVEFDTSSGNPDGYLDVVIGDEDTDSTISIGLGFSFSNGEIFSRLYFRDSRYSNSTGWGRMTGGDARVDLETITSATVVVSVDRNAGTIMVAIDTNGDGVFEVNEIRGGIDFEGIGSKVYLASARNSKLDNFEVGNFSRFVGNSETVPGSEVPLLADYPNIHKEPDIAAFPEGGFVVTFEDRSESDEENVMAQIFDSSYSTVGNLVQVNTNPVHPRWDGNPAVTGLSQGRFVVSWENNDFEDENGSVNDGVGIAAQRFNPNGSKFGPELQLNQFLPGQQKWSDIASDGEDKLFAVWQGGATVGLDDQDGSVEGIIGRPLTFAGVLESELEVADSSGSTDDRYIDFGELMEGTGQQSQTFTIHNEGNADLTVSGLELVGDEEDMFSLTGPANFVLIPGDSQAFTVTFDPRVEGNYFASVTFEHDDISDTLGTDIDDSPHWISLTANVINDPRLEVAVVPGVVREDSGFSAGSVVVTRLYGDISVPLDVVLSSDDTTEAQVTSSVTIPAGETSVVVSLEAIDDNIDDSTQTVTISATASGYAVGSGIVDVLSVNHAPVIENVDDLNVFVGEVVSIAISASDVDTPTDTLTYALSGGPTNAQIDEATGLLTWNPTTEGTFAFTVVVTDDNPNDPLSDTVEFSVDVKVNPSPVVSINDGTGAKSIINELSLTFSEVLTFDSAAFELIQRGPDGGSVAFTATVDDSAGYSVVNFAFSGQFVNPAGSLEDGNYQLTVRGDSITNNDGLQLDADADGVAGGDFIFGDTEADNFFRLYGDSDGNRIVNVFDLLAFRKTYLESDGSEDFDSQFDIDGNGTINVFDLLDFRRNYGDSLEFV